jgi:hypothetical protein
MIFGLFKAIISIHSIIEIHLSIMPNTRKYFNLNSNWQKLCLAVKYGRTVCRLLDPGVTSLHIFLILLLLLLLLFKEPNRRIPIIGFC